MKSFGVLLACLWLTVALDGVAEAIKGGDVLKTAGDYGFHVRIDVFDAEYSKLTQKCNGAIIDQYHVLTSSHCMYDSRPWSSTTLVEPGRIFLRVNCVNFTACDTNEDYFQVTRVSSFHRPKDSKLYADLPVHAGLAILKTYTPIPGINTKEGPKRARLYCQRLSYFQPKEMVLVGFGGTQAGESSDLLRKAVLKVPEREFCDKKWPVRINKATFCAGDSNTAPCTDDIGAPLVKKVGTEYLLWGLTNEHHFNCNHEAGALFVKVSAFKNWVRACQQGTGGACEADTRVNNSIHPIIRNSGHWWENRRSGVVK